jgi:tetratricopeptide (TPR) repeat protein
MKNFLYSSIILFMLVPESATAQELDSLVQFTDLTFTSIFEEMVFSKIDKGQDVVMEDLYLAIDVNSEIEADRYKARINTLIEGFKDEKVDQKKERKKVKQIYEDTHEALMVHYEEDALFPDLFKTGNFNCVTGSIIYSLIFKEFGIPYYIQKGSNHVNLVAYPETSTILVESTDSEKGLVTMTMNKKTEYVDQLARGKLLTQEERVQNSIKEIFSEYAFKEGQIDDFGLASIPYSNRGISFLSELNYEEAYNAFEKSYFLSPGIEKAAVLLQTGGAILHMSDYRDLSHVKLLSKLYRFRELGFTEEVVISEFERITEKVFSDRNDADSYSNAYTVLSKNLDNKELVRKISLIYYGTLIDNLIKDGYVNATIQYLDEIYALDPESRRVQELIRSLVLQSMAENNFSAPSQLAYLDHFKDQFPKVYDMHLMQLVELSLIANTAAYWFGNENAEKGNQFLNRFERQIPGFDEINRISNEIESAYKNAAFYYYRESNIKKAHAYLDRGLEILPSSQYLRNLKSSF